MNSFLNRLFVGLLFLSGIVHAQTMDHQPAANPEKKAVKQTLEALLDTAASNAVKIINYANAASVKTRALGPSDSFVLVEQPLGLNAVVILVFDPAARERADIAVHVTEYYPASDLKDADCPRSKSPDSGSRLVTLTAVTPESGIFMGRTEVDGAHGTIVNVEYTTAAPDLCRFANISLAFH